MINDFLVGLPTFWLEIVFGYFLGKAGQGGLAKKVPVL
jgi:hypothetical protein